MVYKLRLLPRKTYPIFGTTDPFLHDLQKEKLNKMKQTDRQTLNYRMATLLNMVPPEKKDLLNRKKKMWKSEHLFKKYR